MGAIVETSCGRVEGVEEEGIQHFRGIPFARPPVGALRFRAPEPPEPWAGVRDASRFGAAAPQQEARLDRFLPGFAVGEQAEDCLFLNVSTPRADAGRRPVLVWLHGGAFTIGSGSQRMYDPAPLVRRGDVVLVTLNYRLGLLGFFHGADVGGKELGATGNAAILDQIAALRWVRDNAGAFGGDPSNVTVFGESAGGMSVGTLLGTPAARGLFRRAIPQSGAAHRINDREQASRIAAQVLRQLGLAAADAAKLRDIPTDVLLEAQAAVALHFDREDVARAFCPVVDGETLPEPPIEAIRAGLAAEVEVLAGVTRDEWNLFLMMDARGQKLDEEALRRRIERRVPGHGERLVAAYRAARPAASPPEIFSAIEGDRVFRIPSVRLLEAQRAHQPRVHAYLVCWESPFLEGALGACHGIDVPFVWGLVGRPGSAVFAGDGPEALRLRDRMMDAWLAFARNGDPRHTDLPDWPGYDETRRATMLLGAECEVRDDPLGAERRAWDGLLQRG